MWFAKLRFGKTAEQCKGAGHRWRFEIEAKYCAFGGLCAPLTSEGDIKLEPFANSDDMAINPGDSGNRKPLTKPLSVLQSGYWIG